MTSCRCFLSFFFNDTATTEIYTLSLHDALPISLNEDVVDAVVDEIGADRRVNAGHERDAKLRADSVGARSEEHTSELQSQSNLVCRLLLEKKQKKKIKTSQLLIFFPLILYSSYY